MNSQTNLSFNSIDFGEEQARVGDPCGYKLESHSERRPHDQSSVARNKRANMTNGGGGAGVSGSSYK
ncbi:hypothetical protein CMV_006088 [Castanea mollissima]|uniref:Uncharacterized protein n=1 Tax=Castanea mollissima TaxID=60419 RepID=A0A8J4RKC1_9ROSI|nr:hypothetical protein CMV_006088 [Castanea mollissima]